MALATKAEGRQQTRRPLRHPREVAEVARLLRQQGIRQLFELQG